MKNGFGEVENCLSSLLIHVKIEAQNGAKLSKRKQFLQEQIANFQTISRKSHKTREEIDEMKEAEEAISEMLSQRRLSTHVVTTPRLERRISSEKFVVNYNESN